MTKAGIVASANESELSARCRQPLKVLIVAHWFPPDNLIGAVRVGKFAKFLVDSGHEVRVIAGSDPDFRDHSLPVEIPSTAITYLESPIDQIWRRKNATNTSGQGGAAAKKVSAIETLHVSESHFRKILTRHYYALIRIPDARAGWIKPAVAAGTELVSQWRPDLIFASAPPNSALVVASRIARACGAPWVAELRDLWVDNPYYEHPRWRMALDRILERRTLKGAAGLVSVTPPDTESLRRNYKQPTRCILNGFDPADFPKDSPRPGPGDVVSLVYTGNIYAGFRDPTPLFKAINLLRPEERSKVAVHFYGPPAGQVHEFASAQNVVDRVFVHDRVTYRESLAIQCSADVLLLLQWADKKDAGNIPAKFFEYLGAGRPILMMGYEQGTLAQMIRQRNAGLVSNNPALIAEQLQKWIVQRPNGISGLAADASADMTRDEQFKNLEQFILGIVSGHRREAGAIPNAAQMA